MSRPSTTTSFQVGDAEGYITAGSYPDDGLGEIFLKMSKQGSTLAGMMDAFSIAVSIGLQYGVPLETFVTKFTNLRFDPAGLTDDPDVRMAQSIMDYVFRRLALDNLRNQVNYYSDFDKGGEPKVKAFWSVTMYDLKYNLVANPIDRYLLNSPMLPQFVRDDATHEPHINRDNDYRQEVYFGRPSIGAEPEGGQDDSCLTPQG